MAQLEVEQRTAERLRAGAAAHGISVSAYLGKLVELFEPVNSPDGTTESVAEFDQALDELFARQVQEQPQDNRTWSRDEIYADHD